MFCNSNLCSVCISSTLLVYFKSNPGVPFQGDCRTAYLPDTTEGRLLLKRLEYAFLHGLTFNVGTSLSSGHSNVVTWGSIHHKTSPLGGAYSFPDLSFFVNCNEELDVCSVPRGVDL
jgi:deltex-like protein